MAKTWKMPTAQTFFFSLVFVTFNVSPSSCSVCNEDLFVGKRSLSSPNYPDRYPSNVNCTWIIKSPQEDREIVLKFRKLDIEPQALCNFDYIQIGSGSVPGESIIVNKLCGREKPAPIKSHSDALWLRFVSDDTKTFTGFHATWRAKKKRLSQAFPNPANKRNVCGETNLNGIEGTIKSPKFPRKYPYDQQCQWIIKAPVNHRIVIRFQYFELEGASKCRFDYLIVKDGENDFSKTIGRYCGSSKPATITTSSNTANLKFNSDTSIARGGFLIRWKAVDPFIPTTTAVVGTTTKTADKPSQRAECNEQFTSNEGSIQSPLYPFFYPEDIQCTWVISVEKPLRIRLTFEPVFDLENAEQCVYDFLRIRDGPNVVDKEIGKYCGQDTPETILSSSSSLRITFRSDKSGVGKGFFFRWVTENFDGTTLAPTTGMPECGGRLTAASGVITSPEYPMMYPSNQRCIWLLSMASDSQVRLTFDYFDLEDNIHCAYDYLLIHDGADADSPVIGRFCGPSTHIPKEFLRSSGKDLRIEFRSDTTGSKGGFRLSWNSMLKRTTEPALVTTPTTFGNHKIITGCGGFFELGLHSGTMFSPSYPDDYPPNLSCTWSILVDDESQIALSFNEFELDNAAECASDYVIVRDGFLGSSEILGKYCGTDVPVYLLSSGNKLSVTFHTDSVRNAKGFEISWMKYSPLPSGPIARTQTPVSNGAPVCVNEFGSLSGVSAISVNDLCQWNLRAADYNQIQLDFTDFNFGERDTSCNEDYIEIRNGLTEYAPVVAKFCSGVEPYQVTSTARFMTVRYVMSGKVHTSFKLSYKEVGSQKNDEALFAFNKDGCGNSILKPESDDGSRRNNQLGEWPWQAAVMKKGMSAVTCGGVLISPQWIMTAAHCFKSSLVSSEWMVRVGSVDVESVGKSEQRFVASVIRVHPNYNSSSNENDIALIKLHKPAKLNNYVGTICLPDQDSGELYENGNLCQVAGWGSDRVFPVYPLSSLTLPIVSNRQCNTFDEFNVTDKMLCAGRQDGIDTCSGDGGSALMCNSSKGFVAVGINSVGEGCGKSKHYGVYSDVRHYLDWIKVQLFT